MDNSMNSIGNPYTYGVKQTGATGGVLRVRLIDIEAIEARQAS